MPKGQLARGKRKKELGIFLGWGRLQVKRKPGNEYSRRVYKTATGCIKHPAGKGSRPPGGKSLFPPASSARRAAALSLPWVLDPRETFRLPVFRLCALRYLTFPCLLAILFLRPLAVSRSCPAVARSRDGLALGYLRPFKTPVPPACPKSVTRTCRS